MDNQTTVGPKIVKRYANRKLYDTELSKYTTLKAIVESVVSGREVKVVENKTQTDITGQTLLTALVETDNTASSEIETLRDIFKAGGLSKYVAGLKATSGSNGTVA